MLNNIASALDCADMSSVRIVDVRVNAATNVVPQPVWQSPPNFTTGNQPIPVHVAFCRVEAVIEKEIAFELWLPPPQVWNGRFLGLGNGGDAGFINYQDLARGVSRGFASASTDTGHKRSETNWGLGHPDRVENFGYRAHHLLADKAKALIDAFYGTPAKRSYFMGCSGGGMQGLALAQRYPNDYEGIMAGAGGVGMMPLSTRMLWTALAQEKNPEQRLSDAQWNAVARTALDACDANDEIKDGVVEHPASCSFDPAKLQCATGESSTTCLTPVQVRTVRAAYSPLRLQRGPQIDPGFPPGIRYSPTARQIDIAGTLFGDWTYQNPKWDVRSFTLERDVPAVRAKLPYLEFRAPTLSGFQKRGGKLITYHGWMDPTVPPGLTIQFHEEAVRGLGRNADATVRLFMAPGMEHCSRGAGPESFGQAYRGDAPIVDAEHDMLTALISWVEEGRAPNRIIASHLTAGSVDRTRPLCPYPQRARYKGAGSTDDAANFSCVMP
jgi:feruloyl esterase